MRPFELGLLLSSINCLSSSYDGSATSTNLKSILCDVNTNKACCCCFFTFSTKQKLNKKKIQRLNLYYLITSLLPDIDDTNNLMTIFVLVRVRKRINFVSNRPVKVNLKVIYIYSLEKSRSISPW